MKKLDILHSKHLTEAELSMTYPLFVMMFLVFLMTFVFTAAGAGVMMHFEILLAPVRFT